MPLLVACERVPQSKEQHRGISQQLAAPSDSFVHNGVIYRNRAGIVTHDGIETLDVDVEMRNTGGSEIVIESTEGNCNPPLYFQNLRTGREFRWSDIAWSAASEPRAKGVACTDDAVLVTLDGHGRGRFVTRSYPLSAIRGDSLPAGLYRLQVAQVVSHPNETRRFRDDTLIIPGATISFR